jgi:hypothetical protein
VGRVVGATVGLDGVVVDRVVGATVGLDGATVGRIVGVTVEGFAVGCLVGNCVGLRVGLGLGLIVLGRAVGDLLDGFEVLGFTVGALNVGLLVLGLEEAVGDAEVGLPDGMEVDGDVDGSAVDASFRYQVSGDI